MYGLQAAQQGNKERSFSLPFIDQMLDRLAGKDFYCILDGYSGYNQIAIAPEDQEKMTFTCPMAYLHFGECHLVCVMHQQYSSDA